MIRMNVPSFGALFTRLAIHELQRSPLLNCARDSFKSLHVRSLGREGPERHNLVGIVKCVSLLVVELTRQFSKRHLKWFVKWRAAVLFDCFMSNQHREHLRFCDGRNSRKLVYLS